MTHTLQNSATTERPVSDADYVQLVRLVVDAAARVDAGRADTLHELFVNDGILDLGDSTLHGTDAILQWGRKFVAANTYPGIRPVAGNMQFFVRGAFEAKGTTTLTVYYDSQGATATSIPWVVGEDHDRFIQTARGWRFASRQFRALFMRPVDSTVR